MVDDNSVGPLAQLHPVPLPGEAGGGLGLHGAGDVDLLPGHGLDVGLLLLYDRGVCKERSEGR